MLAACSENDLTKETAVQQNAEESAVEFDAYTNRGTTRAGVNGSVTNDNIKEADNAHQLAGFAVFGYYTNGESYTGSSRPDFFYNQKVTYDAGVARWTYTPVKYWPNEFGSDAVSDQVDKLTLFAYLPYVEVNPMTGLVTSTDNATNITGMTRNNATGDPLIKYTSSMIANNSVDLCYGVAAQNFISSNSSANPNTIEAGQPYIDVVKPGTDTDSKIKFDFKHALAQLNVTIDAIVNDQTNGNPETDVQTSKTRIWVRSVTFEGITQTGALNLNSPGSSPNWYDVNGTSLITTGSLTVHDGRKDGREANDVATSETPATLNAHIIQCEPYTTDGSGNINLSRQGVTKTKRNLFKYNTSTEPAVDAPIFVIPTKEKMKVTIVYDVETIDKNLATVLSDGSTKGSTIENRIFKTIEGFGEIVAGKKYTLNLHLGMRTVDFDANVADWDPYSTDVHLPANIAFFDAVTPATDPLGTVNISHDMLSYQYAITGLTANAPVTKTPSSVSATVNSKVDGTGNADKVDGAGVTYVTATFAAQNKTATDKTGTVNITASSKGGTLTINQKATPLKLGTPSLSGDQLTIPYNVGDYDSELNTDLQTSATGLTIIVLNLNGADPAANIAGTTPTITGNEVTLTETPLVGDKLKITVSKSNVTNTIEWTVE
jgi:hypothetical protein